MEYLVEMTTAVPNGVTEQAVNEVRGQEAAHSRHLAEQGALLRLFRPPLQPGEWRTFGLFEATDEAQLQGILSEMPLRIWRTDVVTPLAPHPNDPPAAAVTGKDPEFLVTFTETIPDDLPPEIIEALRAQERVRTSQLADQGHLERLWRLPGEGKALGLWRAHNADEMRTILATLPLREFLATETLKLDVHPSDPALSTAQTSC